MDKIKFAIAAGSYCGGCDMAVVALNELLIPLEEMIELKFWQFAADFKIEDVKSLKDKEIDICLHTGPIRTSEHAEIAHLFRKKSKVFVAFGSCSCFGGIPALANTFDTASYFDEIYAHGYNMDDSGPNHPRPKSESQGRKMTLPILKDSCLPLSSEAAVDYYMPGCPPVRSQFEMFVEVLVNYLEKGDLPEKGTVLAGDTALCDDGCDREKPDEIVIDRFVRPFEIDPDPKKCLLVQGIICMGPATRSGCDGQCVKANMPCRGCFGPAPKVQDHGLKMLSGIASIAGAKSEEKLGSEGLKKLMEQVPDPFGTFYRFAVPQILMELKQIEEKKKKGGHSGE